MKDSGLRRELGLIDLAWASLGGIIGSGWLLASQRAAAIAGPSAMISWLIGGVAVILIGLVYAELGGMLPEAGGIVRYPQYSHGTLVSFLMGWGAWLTYVTVAPAEAEAVTQYADGYLHGLFNSVTGLLTPAGLLVTGLVTVVFFLINYYGVRIFAKVNTTVTWFKFIMPALTIILLIATGHHFSNITGGPGGFAPAGASGMLTAVGTSGIVFSYLGFRQAIDMAGEAKNPGRDVPRAIILAIIIGIVVYFGLQLAFVVGVPTSAVAKGWSTINFSSPFANLAAALNLGWLSWLLYADATISPSGTGLVYTASTSRVLYALAENGYLPPGLRSIHPKLRVPHVALVVNLIAGFISLGPFPAWSKIIGFISVTSLFTYLIGPVSLTVLRRTGANLVRPMKLGGIKWIAPLAFIVGSLIIYWSGWPTTAYALVAILLGSLIYWYYFVKNNFQAKDLKAGVWLVIYLLVMIVLSYVGDKNFGGQGILAAPWDSIAVAVAGLIFYYYGVSQGVETDEVRQILDEQRVAPVSGD